MFIEFENVLDKNRILRSELIKNHTTFHIGGEVEYLLLPKSEEEIIEILKICKKNNKNIMVLGSGSNILHTDKKTDKVVIKLEKNFSNVYLNKDTIIAESGISMKDISYFALENSLTGLEFASGIPGTIGGGTYMNAGAYDGELKNVITNVHTVDLEGNKKIYSNEEMQFAYRKSILMNKNEIITKVELKLMPGDYDEIKSKIDDLTYKRESKQPLSEYSAGSTFKRPKDNYASKLIEEANLKGYEFKNAKVSEKHSGFVINKGDCTFDEMKDFLNMIKEKVYEKSGILLEEEVRIIEE